MRTIRDWFAITMPPAIYALALANTIRQRGDDHLDAMEGDAYNALNHAFTWQATAQGDEYWRQIAEDIRQGHHLVPENYEHWRQDRGRPFSVEALGEYISGKSSTKVKTPTTIEEWVATLKPFYQKKAMAAPRYKEDLPPTTKCSSFHSAITHYIDFKKSSEGEVFWKYVAEHGREYVKPEYRGHVNR